MIGRTALLLVLVALATHPLSGRTQEEPAGTPAASATVANPLVVPPTPTPVAFEAPPNPTGCSIMPRPVEDFVVQPDAAVSNSEPVATPASAEVLSQGPPAAAATVLAIEALERQRVACWNANDWRRILAFYTDEFVSAILADYGPDADEEIAADFLASPEPWDWRDWISVQVRDVRQLPNGQVGAIVDTCEQVLFHIYTFVERRWLIVEAIWLEDYPRSFCTYPPFYAGTPIP